MIKIAVMGLGTVGTGVVKVVEANAEQISRKLGQPLEVKAALVRHFREGPYRSLMTDDFAAIEKDPEIRVVVETIGGVDAALEYTRRALAAGKHVVTANKQLVAERGCELLALAREKGVSYLFEASVGGGIPNYILTRMVHTGASFSDALAEAQAKGYAEADPTADVEGIDAGRKTCILADLAFGHQVDPAAVPMEGLSRLDLRDVEIARRAGFRVKLLGRALRLPEGRRTAYVAPHLLREEHPLANVEDVFNAVVVRGNATGEVMFYGKGAGELPTASACVADVMEALQASPCREEIGWSPDTAGFADPLELTGRYYVRIRGSREDAAGAFGQTELLLEEGGETAFLTGPLTGHQAAAGTAALETLAALRVLE